MEPFVIGGGEVGSDIKIWRDLSHGASQERLDEDARNSVAYLRNVFAGPNKRVVILTLQWKKFFNLRECHDITKRGN